jgi:hypothetical protein
MVFKGYWNRSPEWWDNWKEGQLEYYRKFSEKWIDPEEYLKLPYEELVGSPVDSLREVCKWSDIPVDEDLLSQAVSMCDVRKPKDIKALENDKGN